MNETMLTALISGGLTALASIMVCWIQNNKTVTIIKERQDAVISEIATLKIKIEKHNDFEGRLIKLEDNKESVERRISNLERA